MKRALFLAVTGVMCFHWACKNPFTPRPGKIPPVYLSASRWKTPVHPDSVISNFIYLYDFAQNNLDVEVAIDSYRVCFVENDQGYQYQFKYWSITDGGLTMDFMSYAEEMTATASMFRKIANDGLYFDMLNFNQLKHSVEVAEDTSQYVHPGEDWHVYRMAVSFLIDDPTKDIRYIVDGDVEFYLRKCSDGYYRIIRWIDYTYLNVKDNQKNKVVSCHY